MGHRFIIGNDICAFCKLWRCENAHSAVVMCSMSAAWTALGVGSSTNAENVTGRAGFGRAFSRAYWSVCHQGASQEAVCDKVCWRYQRGAHVWLLCYLRTAGLLAMCWCCQFSGVGGSEGSGGPGEFVISGCPDPHPSTKKFSPDFYVSHGPQYPTAQLRGVQTPRPPPSLPRRPRPATLLCQFILTSS